MPKVNITEKDNSNFEDQQFIRITYNGNINEISSSKLDYSVKFISEDSLYYAIDVLKNQKISAPTVNPTKEGYIFKEWTFNGDAFDFNTEITGDTVLVAEFEVMPCYLYNKTITITEDLPLYIDKEDLKDYIGKRYVFKLNDVIGPSMEFFNSPQHAETYGADEAYILATSVSHSEDNLWGLFVMLIPHIGEEIAQYAGVDPKSNILIGIEDIKGHPVVGEFHATIEEVQPPENELYYKILTFKNGIATDIRELDNYLNKTYKCDINIGEQFFTGQFIENSTLAQELGCETVYTLSDMEDNSFNILVPHIGSTKAAELDIDPNTNIYVINNLGYDGNCIYQITEVVPQTMKTLYSAKPNSENKINFSTILEKSLNLLKIK